MGKIWIIYDESDCDGYRYVEKIFTDEDKADEFIKYFNPHGDFVKEEFEADEHIEYECRKRFFIFEYDSMERPGKRCCKLKSEEKSFGSYVNILKPNLELSIVNHNLVQEAYLKAKLIIEVGEYSSLEDANDKVLNYFDDIDDLIRKMYYIGFPIHEIREKVYRIIKEGGETFLCNL